MLVAAKKWFWNLKLVILLFCSTTSTTINPAAFAQIIPDNTLDASQSHVTPAGVRDLITGGAIRDTTLFHSFTEFNVNNGQQVYFANPANIANILTRVTGSNISRIFGTLGVDGGANLFLINPNGIIFGSNARLDVAGSFTATTANSIIFNNYEFSATNPTAPPLLKINVTPGLQYGIIHPQGQIGNQGNLSVGQDLTLISGNLNLQGQLGAGNDLYLAAKNTITIRDSTSQAFIASADNNLLVQANENLDIFALNHPDSGLFSGKDMVLRSTNPVAGDVHYTSAGSFRIEQLDGSLGSLFSPYGPVIKTGGDVLIGSYRGASLHIAAGGKVEIPGLVIITGADTARGLQETLTLSDGTNVQIAGNTKPTLNIRAGVNPTAIGTPTIPAITPSFFNPVNFSNSPTSADIKVGSIFFADAVNSPIAGQVLLTNQYRPNANLQGDIQIGNTSTSAILNRGLTGGGLVDIDSKGSITINGSINSGGIPVNNRYFGNGGDVRLIGEGNITLKDGASISSVGLLGGNITFKSDGDISFTNADANSYSYANVHGTTGGDITEAAKSIFLNNGSDLIVQSFGQGNAGKVKVTASELVSLIEDSNIRTEVAVGASGNSGGIDLTAKTVQLSRGSDFTADTYGAGSSGTIKVTTSGAVKIDGENSVQDTSSIRDRVRSGSTGNSGGVELTASVVTTSATHDSIAGNIEITGDRLQLRDSHILATTASGNGGDIILNLADLLLLRKNSSISTTAGQAGAGGDGGNININAGFVVGVLKENSDITAHAFFGRGGNINITTNALFGLELREQLTSQSDITAFSQQNPIFHGTVAINTLDLDRSRGLTELPSALTDSSNQIVAGCPARPESRFVVTGRGGLPEDPRATLRGIVVVQDFRTGVGLSSLIPTGRGSDDAKLPLIEAQGWVVDALGNIELVANTTNINGSSKRSGVSGAAAIIEKCNS